MYEHFNGVNGFLELDACSLHKIRYFVHETVILLFVSCLYMWVSCASVLQYHKESKTNREMRNEMKYIIGPSLIDPRGKPSL